MTLFLQATYLSATLSLLYIFALYRSHPFRRLSAIPTVEAFVAGMLAVVLVTLTRRILPIPSIESSAGALFAAAAIEEVAKLSLGLTAIWRLRFPTVIEPIDIAILFGVVGVGFGIYEDFWYIFSTSYPSWIAGDLGAFREVFAGIVLARALPGHILFNAIAGFLLGWAAMCRRTSERWTGVVAALGLAILLHAGFNAIAIHGETPLLLAYVLLLVGVMVILRRRAASRSPFAALIRYVEGEDRAWRLPHSPLEYLTAEGFDWPGKRRGGLFQFYPVILSLGVLFPLLLIGVYFTNRAIWSLAR